ncbi:uncharacterized protein NEMAJ01_1087 [Nematocida major]|uniref:uncharacterized protein n=1 Tax=Nematocida major TaxID=1912982 RepID=UPI0020079EE4|nr:uncharacterized protein NEMAJ01_1087 [Nematocida major]KAH9386191.1 hypothetical protein NEMAJ01_1087 [Nematocida major]
MPGEASTASATVKESIPPTKPETSEAPAEKAKGDAAEKPSAEEKASDVKKRVVDILKAKDGMGRKHIKVGESTYYVVTVDEISRYMELKNDYKTDEMSAFIVYMHEEFVNDLKTLRKKNTVKKGACMVAGIFVLILIALVVFAVLNK